MSSDQKKSRKKKLDDEKSELISNFIDKKQTEEVGEPSSKKNKLIEDDPNDDSLKFFKTIKPGTSTSSTTKNNVVSDFINKPSTSKKTTKKSQSKSKSKKTSKGKSQTDIRQVLSKQEKQIYDAINQSCSEEGVDPYEMQLALAISESLKDTNKHEELNQNQTFENPFSATGKIQPISTVLEKYGFTSKRPNLDIELFMNEKFKKRSKYRKVPTVLTYTSDEQRDDIVRSRVDTALNSILFKEIESQDFPKPNPQVHSFYLMELHSIYRTSFGRSSTENMILSDYYVSHLFEMSNVSAGHMLKDWRGIIGRDPSPEKRKRKSEEFDRVEFTMPDEVGTSMKACQSLNSSCSDIFEGIESFTLDQDEEDVNNHLDVLHEKMSQVPVTAESSQKIAELEDELMENVDLKQADPVEDEKQPTTQCELNSSDGNTSKGIKQSTNVDLTQNDSCDSDATLGYDYESPEKQKLQDKQQVFDLTQFDSSVEDVEMASPECLAKNEVPEKSQLEVTSPNKSAVFDLTLASSNEDVNRHVELDEQSEVPQMEVTSPNNDKNAIYDLTQCVSSNEDVNRHVELDEHSEVPQMEVTSPNNDENAIYDLTQRVNSNQEDIKQMELDEQPDCFDLTQDPVHGGKPISAKNSFDENEVIDISDEEINYSINYQHVNENHSLTQSEDGSGDAMEIDNIVEQSLIDVISRDDDYKIDNSVSELLTNFKESRRSSGHFSRSVKFLEKENINDDSITQIMKKYGVVKSPVASASKKRFSKIQSEPNLEKYSQSSVESIVDVENSAKNAKSPLKNAEYPENIAADTEYSVGNTKNLAVDAEDPKNVDVDAEDAADLTIIDEMSTQNASQSPDMNASINNSLANILQSPAILQTDPKLKPRKSLGIVMNDKYVIDTENHFKEPDYTSMTPHELKLQLFKYGIRPLPVKKAIELLTHIYNQMHPKIRIAMDEEIDANDSRKEMNFTDIKNDIEMTGDEDEYVFQLDSNGILEDEEYILPKMKKSKIPTCLIPLHISFYNMIRSNDTLQKYILEFRPLDLDQIYKHFRKFDLTYQLNDIISFLDKRCITFKTKEKSYSKKHERKKQKRTQKSQ